MRETVLTTYLTYSLSEQAFPQTCGNTTSLRESLFGKAIGQISGEYSFTHKTENVADLQFGARKIGIGYSYAAYIFGFVIGQTIIFSSCSYGRPM